MAWTNFFTRLFRPAAPELKEFDRLLLVFSDIEMGGGGPMDDFPQSNFLGDLLLSYNRYPFSKRPIDLVLNGDTFDLLKTPCDGAYPHLIDRDIALAKMRQVAGCHAKFFTALREFLGFRRAPRRVHFIVGNHDFEILFPEVQAFLSELCGAGAQVFFPGFGTAFGDVKIEHGSQHDTLFYMNPAQPFIKHEGRDLLNVTWATVAILNAVMPLQPACYHLDRIKPRDALFSVLPEVKELLVSSFWKYWTRDFFKGYMSSSDPFKKVTWRMFKEVMRRFSSLDPEVQMGNDLQKEMRSSNQYSVYIVGHKHEVALSSYGDRKFIQTGCFRNEFMMSPDGARFKPMPKSYAEVYMKEGKAVCSHLVEVPCPPLPENEVPRPLNEYKTVISGLLGPSDERVKRLEEMKKQELAETVS